MLHQFERGENKLFITSYQFFFFRNILSDAFMSPRIGLQNKLKMVLNIRLDRFCQTINVWQKQTSHNCQFKINFFEIIRKTVLIYRVWNKTTHIFSLEGDWISPVRVLLAWLYFTGLFHKAISQSGVATNPVSWTEKAFAVSKGFELAEKLGKVTTDPKVAYEFLKTIDAKKLVKVQQNAVFPREVKYILKKKKQK